MTRSQPEELEDFLRRQSPDALVGVLLELAAGDEAVQQRLARLQLADRPGELAAVLRKQLTAWRRSTKYHSYRETREYAGRLEGWLDQVAHELLPREAKRRTRTAAIARRLRGRSPSTARPQGGVLVARRHLKCREC